MDKVEWLIPPPTSLEWIEVTGRCPRKIPRPLGKTAQTAGLHGKLHAEKNDRYREIRKQDIGNVGSSNIVYNLHPGL